jgi:GAF domain-containing protein
MQSENEKLTFKGLFNRILAPDPKIRDAGSRQQAYLTTLASAILGTISLAGAITGLFIGLKPGIEVSLFFIALAMAIATALGRTDNFLAGSTVLVSAIILGGFLLSSVFPGDTTVVLILISSIVAAFTLAIVLLPVIAIIIISVVTIITIGVLPLVAVISVGSGAVLFICLIIIEGVYVLTAWIRDITENQQIDELSSLRGRLEERVEERTRYTRIAADIAQDIISASTMEELFNLTVAMVTARLGFTYAGIYVADEADRLLTLTAAEGPGAQKIISAGKKVTYGLPALLGWVAENKQQRIFSRTVEDPLQLETEFLPECQSEISIPILSRDNLLGILDVQSIRTTIFDNETIVVLQTLSDQIAVAIQNLRLMESERGSIREVAEVTQAGYKIARAESENEIYQTLQELFSKISLVTILLTPAGKELRLSIKTGIQLSGGQNLPDQLSVSFSDFEPFMTTGMFIGEGNRLASLPYDLVRILNQLEIFSVALIPVVRRDATAAILLIATREKQPLSDASMQPYVNIAELIANTMDRIQIHTNLVEETHGRGILIETSADFALTQTPKDVYDATQRMFRRMPYAAILLVAENSALRIATSVDSNQEGGAIGLPETINVSPDEVLIKLGGKTLTEEVSKLSALYHAQFHPELQKFIEDEASRLPTMPAELIQLLEDAQFITAAFIPIKQNEKLVSLIVVGTKNDQTLTQASVDVYSGAADLVSLALNRIQGEQSIERRLNEDEAIILVSQEVSTVRDLPTLYRTLHNHISQTLGDISFLVAIYNPDTASIAIPYMFEKGRAGGDITQLDTFPLGEGLTSILIRTKQPLMLVEDLERRANALGAKISGVSPKSWLGAPLVVSGDAIGAIVLQDPDQEHAFNENDLRFVTTLSSQVAGAIFNTRLLQETDSRAIQLQTAAEIARDISGSLDLGELLNKAVSLIRDRFNYYHAAIFLVDAMSEFAVIREATGEAGTQMKRAGHKLKIGSKSIVGYVAGSGEPLIANDTARDATYFANPLLPETRAEVAIPLKVGQRILGVLDVQSTQSYSFGDEDVNVLRILADQMAIAVINSELFADTQEHLSQHRLLHHVTTAAASGTTLEESLNSATQGLQVTLGGDRVSILLADKETKKLRVKAFAGYSEDVEQLEIPFGEGITGWTAVHQQPQRINDVTQDSRYIKVGSNIRSELAIPLTYRGELLGVLNVESDQISAYNENDEELLGTLGGSLAAIISNARLLEQVRRQVDRERMLYEVTSKIRRSTDMQTIMATTTSELSKVLGASRAQIKIDVSDESKNKSGTDSA